MMTPSSEDPGPTRSDDRPPRGVRRAGTRGSPLALIQARQLLRLLATQRPSDRSLPDGPLSDGPFREHVITTTGDSVQDRTLADIGGKGLFAKEIHEALLDRRIDCAVHSLKDLETELPPGIVLACALGREDARDVLILADPPDALDPADPFAALPAGAVVGTASVRRQAQLLHARPDLAVVPLRGNVQTRLRKLDDNACRATLLAFAGLKRLGISLPNALVLDPEAMLPAAGQGIIGVTARADDADMLALLAAVEDADSRTVAAAERAMLGRLDGSCRTPIGAYARLLPDGGFILTGMVARPDGSFLLKRSLTGPRNDAERLGAELGDQLRADSPADLFA